MVVPYTLHNFVRCNVILVHLLMDFYLCQFIMKSREQIQTCVSSWFLCYFLWIMWHLYDLSLMTYIWSLSHAVHNSFNEMKSIQVLHTWGILSYLSTLPIWPGPSLFLNCLPLNFCSPEFLPFSANLKKFYVFTCFFLLFHYFVTTFIYFLQEKCLRTLSFTHGARYY